MFSKQNLFLLFLVLVGTFLRFYNLLWGAPFFFHPDERNIVYAISQLSFPQQFNPHFFAYGSLPIYAVYFINNFFSFILKRENDFASIIFWLRFFSATFSLLLIPSLYIIVSKLFGKTAALITAFLATFSVGFIQYAHFGTFEMWNTFFTLWLFYFSIRLTKGSSFQTILRISTVMGILLSVKVSNSILFPLPILGIVMYQYITIKSLLYKKLLGNILLYIVIVAVIFVVTNPFALLDFQSFFNSIHYESSVALGTLPVFYTGSFFNTIPILFQFSKVYPFLVNPFVEFLFIPAFFFVIFKGIKNKNMAIILLAAYYILVFLSQAFFYVKWTRYVLPTLPFLYIMTAMFLTNLPTKLKKITLVFLGIFVIIYSYAFIKTVYFSQDTRIAASVWAKHTIASTSPTVSEPYDLGIIPFNPLFPNIQLIPVYDIETNADAFSLVQQNLSQAKIFIIPSQRLIHSRMINKTTFPKGNTLYTNLLDNKTDFKKVYETPCNIFCKIVYDGDPLFNVEETTTVFDRPTVVIFEKKL